MLPIYVLLPPLRNPELPSDPPPPQWPPSLPVEADKAASRPWQHRYAPSQATVAGQRHPTLRCALRSRFFFTACLRLALVPFTAQPSPSAPSSPSSSSSEDDRSLRRHSGVRLLSWAFVAPPRTEASRGIEAVAWGEDRGRLGLLELGLLQQRRDELVPIYDVPEHLLHTPTPHGVKVESGASVEAPRQQRRSTRGPSCDTTSVGRNSLPFLAFLSNNTLSELSLVPCTEWWLEPSGRGVFSSVCWCG